MPSYLTPGVYVEEVPSAGGTLSAGLTAVAAFVGYTAAYPTDDPSDPQGLKPRLVTSWSQYENLYGGFVAGAVLPLSVYGFFNNGGGMAYIVRVQHQSPSEESGQLALPAVDRAIGLPLTITSIGPADGLAVAVEPGTEVEEGELPLFNMVVEKNGVEVERFDDVSLESISGSSSELVEVSVEADLSALPDKGLAQLKAGIYPVSPAAPLPVDVRPKDFVGSESDRVGINGLVIADEVTMVM
ncbi:MAG: phage tail sheath family protein, partial [Acidimicrobiales bacterium]|nr:phage tail sheath family protein [Acidimicrobiales bacterium]